MSPLDSGPTFVNVLKAVDSAQKEHSSATPDLIAEKCGLEVEEVKVRLAEACSKGLVFYFNSSEETALPTAPGWTLTAMGRDMIEGRTVPTS
jgi:RIO-like serine/threonine protein kinase